MRRRFAGGARQLSLGTAVARLGCAAWLEAQFEAAERRVANTGNRQLVQQPGAVTVVKAQRQRLGDEGGPKATGCDKPSDGGEGRVQRI
ncbi:hypothetical protein NDU88_000330 [Pleurodeles waltl]|uniref:Secreted protein n=1 Tax=Pleurodeles waltl TaxID=8319 RepID=A0AAV7VWA6_PLEWA|nr:hypothetical protein NDU88_000330 [Pleurodeles waltl]